jgi:hypothetical protein
MSELYEDLLWFRQMDNDMDKFLVSLRDREGQAGGVPQLLRASAPAERGESVSSLRITEVPERFHQQPESKRELPGTTSADKSVEYFGHAPEPHEPTKVLGWLLVGFAGFCVYVLGATIFKFWPVIVRTLR